MNNISESLLSAIDILTDNKLNKLQYDKTVQAEIFNIVNLNTGEYKVKYSGNIFSAFSTDVKQKYKIGDGVYVIIPEGEFSNRKIIHSKIKDQVLSYGEMMSLSNSIVETSPTLDTMYTYDKSKECGVVAGAPQEDDLGHFFIFENLNNDYHGLFQQYSNNNNLLSVKASFLTQFHNEHTQGNYGLELVFFTKGVKYILDNGIEQNLNRHYYQKDGNKYIPVNVEIWEPGVYYYSENDTVSYKLDLNSFNGDPYSLSIYSPQSSVISFQTGFLTGLKSIKLFQENFIYDRYIEDGLVTIRENRTIPNILVKDIEISFVKKVDLTDNLYYLDILTPQGNSFTSTILSLDLVPRLIYEGDNIFNTNTCTAQWFKQDFSVLTGSEYYNKQAGAGWKEIGSDVLNLKIQDVPYQQKYKLLVNYQDVVLSAEIIIYNLETPYNMFLEQQTTGDNIQLKLINKNSDEVLYGNWYLSYPDGSYSFIENRKNVIEVTEFLIYSSVNFYCEVYDYSQENIIGNLEYTISSGDSEADVTISFSGEDQFKYDANGDISIEDAEKERTLQVSLAWKDGVGSSYSVEWLAPDGEQITNIRKNPTQSMIENLWVDNNDILHYNIKQKYKINYNNNTIVIKVITIDGKEYEFKKEILFLKDGDQGTNGTTYVTAIRPFDLSTGLKLSGLNPLIYQNGECIKDLPLKCYVYKDGELINNNNKYSLEFKWTFINVNYHEYIDNVLITGVIGEVGVDIPYVKVQVTIQDELGSYYDIYSLYPIDVIENVFDIENINKIDINSIPSYIKYTSSGINPSFYNNNITCLYNSQDYSSQMESLTPNLINIEINQDGLIYLKPVSSFIFENNSIGLLSCKIDDMILYHPIIMFLDNYGNEAINGWDGTSIQTENGYILAPQIGAGEKDSANRFTGVVMGKDSQQKIIGLYGYQSGINTFGLMENGKAFFGAKTGGGQIIIDGEEATIYGGGYEGKLGGEAENGMTITLANLEADKKTSAIKVGKGVFQVFYDGSLEATSAIVSGDITANTGYIGGRKGWTVQEYRIFSGSGSSYVELNSNNTRKDNNEFEQPYAIWCGSSTASNASFSVTKKGELKAISGQIGGWHIGSTVLTSGNGSKVGAVGMSSGGSVAFWAGGTHNNANSPPSKNQTKFYVDRNGNLYCRGADIGGTIESDSGKIGGWTISSSGLSNGDTYLTKSGLTTENITITYNGSKIGELGLIVGKDALGDTYNIGIESTNSNQSIILRSARNISMETDDVFYVKSRQIKFTALATAQEGIYARFA